MRGTYVVKITIFNHLPHLPLSWASSSTLESHPVWSSSQCTRAGSLLAIGLHPNLRPHKPCVYSLLCLIKGHADDSNRMRKLCLWRRSYGWIHLAREELACLQKFSESHSNKRVNSKSTSCPLGYKGYPTLQYLIVVKLHFVALYTLRWTFANVIPCDFHKKRVS